MATISLGIIAKNEEHNLPKLLDSVKGMFDEICVTDTGSTDRTIEIAKEYGCKVSHFEWIKDFAAARNFNLSQCTSDYYMWMDCDDVFVGQYQFLEWKKHTMDSADYWLATYDYASDDKGNVTCSFARERAFRTNRGMQWKYFVHEGVIPSPGVAVNYIPTWKIRHCRTQEDLAKDKGRNLGIFETNKDNLDTRMTYYYGKELFENGKAKESYNVLLKACATRDLEYNDRILAHQYACYAGMVVGNEDPNKFAEVINLATSGIQIAPNRAEFFNILGDCYVKLGRLGDAVPYYTAATACVDNIPRDRGYAGAVYIAKDAYTTYPRNQLARVFSHMGDWNRAKEESWACYSKHGSEEAKLIYNEITKAAEKQISYQTSEKCNDIVFTCLGGLYEWDEEISKTRGVGGSEIATIHMAKHLASLSGKKVKIFNQRKEDKTINGIEYISTNKIPEYFSKYEPYMHIAWRHGNKFTNAPTYVWSHDLVTPGSENITVYDKLLCLSNFHGDYASSVYGIPKHKIHVTRNGIDPARFMNLDTSKKDPNKIVFASSPDRGLERAIRVCERIREVKPVELHVFYGFDNMVKMGLKDEVKRLMSLCDKPWVKMYGNVQQEQLPKHYQNAAIWLYPTNFLETYCITALEMLCCGVYPVVRKYGALKDTLSEAKDKGMASILDVDCYTESEVQAYADEVCRVIEEKRWDNVKVNPSDYSWENVAKEWLRDLHGRDGIRTSPS